jgi:hypothetical protein
MELWAGLLQNSSMQIEIGQIGTATIHDANQKEGKDALQPIVKSKKSLKRCLQHNRPICLNGD